MISDKHFQEWTRKQPCASCGGGDWIEEIGEFRCEFAHSRLNARGGTSYKPPYSGLPLCHSCHSKSHLKGITAIMTQDMLVSRTGEHLRSYLINNTKK